MAHVEEPVTIVLSGNEAIVLFELLSRIEEDGNLELIEHPAEAMVLRHLEADLEKALVAPFSKDYQAILSASRERIAGGAS